MGLFASIGRRYRSFRRYNQILRVFVKYGFEDIVSQMIETGSYKWLRRFIPNTTRKKAKLHSKWEKMRLLCEELGPTFVKFGQILSNRSDLLPAELIVEFAKLQDNVPPFPGAVARKVLETELKKSTDILFSSFEPEPFASASMAQVHKATLPNGQKVALKIQRPDIHALILEDIRVMYTVAGILERRFPTIRPFDPLGLVRHFEESILKELDFIHESINAQRFYHNLVNDPSPVGATCPKIFPELTTQRILTMEFVNGIKISNYDELLRSGHDRNIIAEKLAKSYVKQVFEYGFFHADLHPGNILVLPNGDLSYLDFGLMGSIMQRDIEMFGRLFIAVKEKDIKTIIRALQQMSGDFTIKEMRAFEFDISEFVNRYSVSSLHSNEMSVVLMEMKDIIVRHGLKVPSHFFLLARSMVTVEGVIHNLDPKLDLMTLARPYMRSIIAKKLNPIVWGKKIFNTLYEFGAHMEDFPRDLKNAIRRINSGQINVNLNHKGIDPMVYTINRISKQIVSALLASGLLVAGILLIINKIGPMYKTYSILGLIGIIAASIIILGMVRDILKGDRGSMKEWEDADQR